MVATSGGLEPATATVPSSARGERKVVSILFADLVDSYALVEGTDVEETSEFLNRVLDYMCGIVRFYGGTVISRGGDGIMAVFGAPKALEAHEVRAVRAALDIQQKWPGDPIDGPLHGTDRGQPGFYTSVHCGEVLVKADPHGRDLPEVFGEAVYLAARLNKVGGAGAVTVTQDVALKLNGGTLESLGDHDIRGRRGAVEVFRVHEVAPERLEMHGALQAGFSPFVGRQAELSALAERFRRACAGKGGICSVIGEAGSGKSRLLHEFRNTLAGENVFVLRGGCEDFGGSQAYQPFRAIVAPLLDEAARNGITDDARRALGPTFFQEEDRDAALQAILGRLPPHAPWHGYDPGRKTALIRNSILVLLRRLAETRPVLVEIEDIHWIDRESARCLAALFPGIAADRVLVVVTSRKRTDRIENAVPVDAEIPLHMLSADDIAAIARQRLGPTHATDALVARIGRLSGGNPFFVEECIRLVQEVGSEGSGGPGQIAFESIRGSDIQSILAARIDDLPDSEARDLIAACSAIGSRFEWSILERVVHLPPERLGALVGTLADAELIFPESSGPRSALRFKHAITREVAYQGMTRSVRAGHHASVLAAYETWHGEHATEFADILKEHAKRAGDTARAIRYQRISAGAALDRSAHSECLALLEDCLEMARTLPDSEGSVELQIDLLFDLRNCLEIIESGRIFESLNQAAELCGRIDDDRRKGILASHLAHAHWAAGRLETALEHGLRAVEYGVRLGDPEIRIPGLYHSGLVLLGMGRHAEASRTFAEVIEAAEGTNLARRFHLNVSPSMLARSYRARCLAEMAEYEDALAEAEAARRHAKNEREHYATGFAELAFGHTFIAMGESGTAIPHLERSVEGFLASDAKVMCAVSEAFLGYALALSGRGAEAVPRLEAAVEASRAAEVWEQLALRTMFLSEAYLSIGDLAKAADTLEAARQLAVTHREQPSLAYIEYQSARIGAARTGGLSDPDRALLHSAAQRAEAMQMVSLARRCRQLLAA